MKNEKGSVLVWAIVIILIFSIFAGAALTITYSMVKRSIGINVDRQLYLTARSAVDVVASEMVSQNGDVLINELVANKTNVQITNDFFADNDDMRDCTLKAVCNNAEDQIIVTAVASQDDQQEIVSAVIQKDSDSNTWAIVMFDNKDINEPR